jgi:hypothetical protein
VIELAKTTAERDEFAIAQALTSKQQHLMIEPRLVNRVKRRVASRGVANRREIEPVDFFPGAAPSPSP